MKIYTDGVFDLFHYGHANALRQAKLLGDFLVAGVNLSESASYYKSTPILTDKEKLSVLHASHWVDEVIQNAPYFLDYNMVKKLECNLVVHGDDEIVDSNGNHCYADAVKNNKFAQFERAKGISTIEIFGRLLYKECRRIKVDLEIGAYHDKLIELFALTERKKEGIIGYIDGSFDLYHAGHASCIEEAKRNCDYLILGLHDEEEILKFKGEPSIMRHKERKLYLMSNKYVDEIIENVPFYPTIEFVTDKKIDVIYCGKESKYFYDKISSFIKVVSFENRFYYLNCNLMCDRIIANYLEYAKKAGNKKIILFNISVRF